MNINRMIARQLKELANRIDAGNCEITDEEAAELLQVIGHRVMSKEDACIYLNVSRSKFDEMVREGKLPRGRKHRGFKELRWYKEDIDKAIR